MALLGILACLLYRQRITEHVFEELVMERFGKIIIVLVVTLVITLPLLAKMKKGLIEADAVNETRSGESQGTPENHGPAMITKAKANLIQQGMTYAECVKIIGCEGDPYDNPFAGMGGFPNDEDSESYMWHFPNMAKIEMIHFRDGVVVGGGNGSSPLNRKNHGWSERRSSGPPYIDKDTYMKLKTGMSYDKCVKILGTEGTYIGKLQATGGGKIDSMAIWSPYIETRICGRIPRILQS